MSPEPPNEDDKNDEKRRREQQRAGAWLKPQMQRIRQAQQDDTLQSPLVRVAGDRNKYSDRNAPKRDTTWDKARRRPAQPAEPVATPNASVAQPRQSSSLHRPEKGVHTLKRPLPDDSALRKEAAEKRRAEIAAMMEMDNCEGDETVTPAATPPRGHSTLSGSAGTTSASTMQDGASADREPVWITDGSSIASSAAASPRQSRDCAMADAVPRRSPTKPRPGQRKSASPAPSRVSRETRFWSIDRPSSPSAEGDELDQLERGPVEEEPHSDHELEHELSDPEPFGTEPHSGYESEQGLFDQDLLSDHEDVAPASDAPLDFPTATFSAPASEDSFFESDADDQPRRPAIHTRGDVPSAPSVPHLSSSSSPAGSRQTSPTSSRRESISGISLNSSIFDPSPACQTDGTLGRYLHAIREQDTKGSDDHLDAQGKVYDKVIRDFFDVECDCPNPRERDEPENAHTIQERVTQLQQSLPPLAKIFGDDGSYDPSVHFTQWKNFLSHQPTEPLSFRKTQEALPQRSVTVERQWDIDSVWIGATDLAAIRAPNDFRLTFLPHFSLNLATDQVIQPHGLDLANTRHIPLGSFSTPSVRFTVYLFFPCSTRSGGLSNALSLDRQKDLYDKIIIPAAYESVRDPIRQEIPRTFDMVYAKSRSYREKPGILWAALCLVA